jgi:hypothetical protein
MYFLSVHFICKMNISFLAEFSCTLCKWLLQWVSFSSECKRLHCSNRRPNTYGERWKFHLGSKIWRWVQRRYKGLYSFLMIHTNLLLISSCVFMICNCYVQILYCAYRAIRIYLFPKFVFMLLKIESLQW